VTATEPRAAGIAGKATTRRPVITRSDFSDAVDFAALTAGVIGAVLLLYGLGSLLGTLTHFLGVWLYTAANGGMTP